MFRTAMFIMLAWVAAWTACYLLFIRRWLLQYAITAGLVKRMEAAEGRLWSRTSLWFEGKKTLLVAFLMSGLGAAKSAANSTVTGLAPGDLEPLRDAGVWHAFFADDLVLKIMSGLAILAGLLAIKGHLTAAKIQPKE